MQKIKRVLLAVTLFASLLCLALGLAACNSGSKLSTLRVENARVNFMRGDAFETGDDFTVIAVYSDGTEQDVTPDAVVRQENGMDMNVPGDYQITVSYQNKRVIYTVYVNDSADVLRKIELDTSAVKKNYELGDAVSLDGLKLTLTYRNSQGVDFPVETESLRGFNVEIKGEDGTVIDDVFTSLGTFTVTVSQGSVKDSFTMTVDGINISTVQSALVVGGFYKSKVSSGDALIKEQISNSGLHDSEHFQYVFGDNYTRFTDVYPDPTQTYHCSLDSEGIFIVYLQGDKISTSNRIHPDMMNGSPFRLWYNRDTVYGIEGVLNNLYARAVVCSNDDLKETVDEANREYSFSFSGLELRSNSSDYFETTVSFTLSEDYTIASVEYRQDYYEDNSAWAEGERKFVTDPVTGKTTPVGNPSHYTIVTVTQTVGERTAENDYSRDMFKFSSFDLKYNDQILNDGDTLECTVETGAYQLSIENILPATAAFEQDEMYFDYEGNRSGSNTMLSNEHFTLYRRGKEISLTVTHGGTWTLIFETEKVTKRLVIHVTGENPNTMTEQLYNAASGSFYYGNTKTLALNGEIYFYGLVDSYANDNQTAQLISGDESAVTLERAEIGGEKCFKFSASVTGVYEVRVVSDAAPSINRTFTFTVSDAVDFDALLSGSYTAEDAAGDIYVVTFHRADEGGVIKGTFTVTRTPTEEDGTPIEGKTVTQTLSFYVDGLEIVVEHGQNDVVWVEFSVDEENNLQLVDQHNLHYPLERVEA